jgi:hypothetical protein
VHASWLERHYAPLRDSIASLEERLLDSLARAAGLSATAASSTDGQVQVAPGAQPIPFVGVSVAGGPERGSLRIVLRRSSRTPAQLTARVIRVLFSPIGSNVTVPVVTKKQLHADDEAEGALILQ